MECTPRTFASHFTEARRTIPLPLFVARLRYRYFTHCCATSATSCKSCPLKPEKTLELGRPFFSVTDDESGSRRATRGRRKILNPPRSPESGANPCENNVEGWIMMIVETTGARARTPRNGRLVFRCIAHPSVTHNRQSSRPSPAQFSPKCARPDKLVLFHPHSSRS